MILCTSFSLQGKSHIKSETPCQDASITAGIIGDWTVIISADGVGSCAKSDIGAKTAVETALQICQDCFPPDGEEKGLLAMLRTAFNGAYNKICRIAAEHNDDVFQYETTLDVALFNGSDKIYYGHSGDGGIFVLNGDREYHEITKVQEGEEANSVSPLFSGNKVWDFGVYEDYKISAVACFTDGIRDKLSPQMLENQKYTINVPLANRFMYHDVYGMNDEEARETIKKKLNLAVKYLKSSQCPIVDDVTMAIAINTDVFVEEPPYEEPNYLEIEKAELEDLYPSMPKIDKRKLFLNFVTEKRETLGIEEANISALVDDYYPLSPVEKKEWEKKYGKPSPEPDTHDNSISEKIKSIFSRNSSGKDKTPETPEPEKTVPEISAPKSEPEKTVPEISAPKSETEKTEPSAPPSVPQEQKEIPPEKPMPELTPEEKRMCTSPEELDIPVSDEKVIRSEFMSSTDKEYSYMLNQSTIKDGQIKNESYELSVKKITETPVPQTDAPEKNTDKTTGETIEISS